MKKLIVLVILLAIAAGAFFSYELFLGSATQFSGSQKFLYIHTDKPTREAVITSLKTDSIIKKTGRFDWLASKAKYWENIKPGKYKIRKGMSISDILKLLKSGAQEPSRLVINKIRTGGDFARLIGKAIESDSLAVMGILTNKDSLAKFDLTTYNWPAYIIPDTYEVYWTWGFGKVMQKLKDNHERWWSREGRLEKAAKLKLSPEQVHTMASIVEEETNIAEDKSKIASVYLNRIKVGMPLQADPTIRYALKDFKMNRVLYSHLRTPSAYNTYLNRGLPPGPICTPSASTIDAVLDAPETGYIFFVAKADLKGGSTFTTNLADHNRAAKLYQDSLTAWLKRKAAREKALKDSISASGNPAKT